MNQHDIFNSLASNAFDFLERGITEFDEAPKYSAIHFCAAVEMLLKARLMTEHWALIVSKPEEANLEKFMAGDFISATMKEARIRLRDIAEEDIPNDVFSSFQALATHRNKMIHFFHADMNNEQARALIVAEHCRSWFHLHRLLDRWGDCFADFKVNIAQADRSMKKHKKYLTAKFNALKSELSASGKAGKKPRACNACGFKAAIPKELSDSIVMVTCRVCDHSETQVGIDCPHCKRSIVIASGGYNNCPRCSGAIEPEDISNWLCDHGDASHGSGEDDYQYRDANCGCCEGYHTVISLAGGYFCVKCFELADRLETCEWCNEPNTGDMEGSYFGGCGICEGKRGWGDNE
ncbi:MAG: hypothetical protein COZ12_02015 [Deltaproteobacteria bacterium CG_4_10_14_3_um_filter_60_8]|nr:MAG: hypothetical protein COZ12_02015 [Deltaproteobacteria bacterium CG_4_10_14_3_um_filter_60_8]